MENDRERRGTAKNTDNLLPPMGIGVGLLMVAIGWLLAASFAMADDVEYLVYKSGKV